MPYCLCPNCGEDISEFYQPADPEHPGPFPPGDARRPGWFCDDCEMFVEEEDE